MKAMQSYLISSARQIIPVCLLIAGISLPASAQQVMRVAGAQMVLQPGARLVIKGGISFSGLASVNHQGTISLYSHPVSGTAHWLDSTAGGVITGGNGLVELKGTLPSLQIISGKTVFPRLELNNRGTEIHQSTTVSKQLNLESGLVYFQNATDTLTVTNTAISSIASGNGFATSWVNGRLTRRTATTGIYHFPVGKLIGDSLYAPIQIQKTNSNSASYTAVYLPQTPPDNLNFLNPPIDHISYLEYWTIESDAPGGSADDDCTLSLSWRSFSQVNSSPLTRDSLLVAHYVNNAGFRWEPEFNTGLPNIVTGSTTFGYVTTNQIVNNFTSTHSNFTLGSSSPFNVLPVKLLNWNVWLQNGRVSLNWEMENDRDVVRYEVEKLISGSNHQILATQMANRITGRSNYRAIDPQPARGWNYYRLKYYDDRGRSYYAEVKKIWLPFAGSITLYPNPARNQLILNLPEPPQPGDKIRILNAAGQWVMDLPATQQQVLVSVSRLSAGKYWVQYWSRGKMISCSMVKE